MLEHFKEALDKGDSVSAISMDLSKAFETLNYNLIITKLEAYGFSEFGACISLISVTKISKMAFLQIAKKRHRIFIEISLYFTFLSNGIYLPPE